MRHLLSPSSTTTHGAFSRELPPVLIVDSGDTVEVAVPDAGWHTFEQERPLSFEGMVKLPWEQPGVVGHCLIGPIAVRGAKAGMALEIRIDEVVPGSWGWGAGGGWDSPLNAALGLGEGAESCRIMWDLDRAAGLASNDFGDRVKLRPFPGVVGMPPPARGSHSTIPPRRWGGNLDCRELIAGASLFLPVPVDGGLLSLGDGHGTQGDGELSGIAIECPMEKLVVTLTLHPELSLSHPRAVTPAGRITFGVAPTLDRAASIAVDGMLSWMGEIWGLTRSRALALASLAVDLRVTQAVNGVLGAHAVLVEDRLVQVGPG
ncbi:MAG: acetamidase/formamidase family protein [Deltaproteobacteria bacterium]|nr:acetamidase/formamidase family protein [Deltaproteobacteria bacterium]